jgi:hypothetical protein
MAAWLVTCMIVGKHTPVYIYSIARYMRSCLQHAVSQQRITEIRYFSIGPSGHALGFNARPLIVSYMSWLFVRTTSRQRWRSKKRRQTVSMGSEPA